MQNLLANKTFVTFVSILLMFLGVVVYLAVLSPYLQPTLDTIPLPGPIKGAVIGIIMAMPGAFFGYKYGAFGSGKQR